MARGPDATVVVVEGAFVAAGVEGGAVDFDDDEHAPKATRQPTTAPIGTSLLIGGA